MVILVLLLALPVFLKRLKCSPVREVKRMNSRTRVSVVSRRSVSKIDARSYDNSSYHTTVGHVARNEMDSHADTCCAGANWALMDLTGELCQVTPFLESYDPVEEIPVARCATVWTSNETHQDYLLVCDQMLWFGNRLPHSLINPNQLRAYGVDLNDNPYDAVKELGMTCGDNMDTFVPFDNTGTLIHFESRVPTEQEMKHLPVILLTDSEWDPSKNLVGRYREDMEMRTIRSLTSGVNPRQIMGLRADHARSFVERYGEVETELGKISPAYNIKSFCDRAISVVNIATHYRDDIDGDKTEGDRKVSSIISNERHSQVTPEELARKWNIGLKTVKDTLRVTTQRGVRTVIHPATRRYRVDHLNLHRPRLAGTWYCDTLLARTKSKLGNTCANVFTNGKYTKPIPMPARREAGQSLITFTDDVGIPERLVMDQAGEFTGKNKDFQKESRKMRIQLHFTEEGRKNQNMHAENEIRLLSQRWRLRMTKKKVYKRLWDFGVIYEGELLTRMARGRSRRTGLEEITGDTTEIAEWLDFEFFDLVWYHDAPGKPNLTDNTRKLARWLGISHRVGSDLCYWLVTPAGRFVSRTTVQHVTREDYVNPDIKRQIDEFNDQLAEAMRDDNFAIEGDGGYNEMYLDDIDEDDTNPGVTHELITTPPIEEYGDMIQEDRPDDDDEEAIDRYLDAELIFDAGSGEERFGRVVKRARGLEGEPIGRAHVNPLFDTREYEVEFTDGTREKYQANVIAENIFAQVDDEGRTHMVLEEIVDHVKDGSAVPISDGMIRSANGTMKPKKTTRGWKLVCLFRGGCQELVDLKTLKESNPIELAEYAVAHRLVEEAAFKWWVPHVLKRRNRIISKLKSRYWRTTHKFGIRLPKTVEEALDIDRKTGTDYWYKAINKEMSKVKVAWEAKEGVTPQQVRDGESDLVGYQEIGCHLVFDVKMDYTRKARYCAGGHTTEAPASITYSSVVSRESVRLAFLIAELNGVDIMACDLENAYLNAKCREKIWFEGGVENGEDRGKVCVLVRALYGLKSAGASWRTTLANVLRDLGYESTKADPDVWIRPAMRDDGFEYYEMLFVYVDDILSVSHKAKERIAEITEFYKAKDGSIQPPKIYLGADVSQMTLEDGRTTWTTSPRTYVKNSIKVVEDLFAEDGEGYGLKSKVKNPFPSGYRPETDVSAELDDKLASRYMQLIGIARWAVELGRIDIHHEIAILSQYQANPRVGHLEALYNVFAYLKNHLDMGRIAYDSITPPIDESVFNHSADWTDFYGDVQEELPANMPKPCGNPVLISCFVDANHAGNVVTRRSHTGIIIFVQNAPIIWYSKRQNTVETSTFGSELVAQRTAKELIVALRYKLRMFGIPLSGPADVYCDNSGVQKNLSIPESTLLKKHNSVNYHSVREAVAAGILRVGKEDGKTNIADLLTKVVVGDRRWQICHTLMR